MARRGRDSGNEEVPQQPERFDWSEDQYEPQQYDPRQYDQEYPAQGGADPYYGQYGQGYGSYAQTPPPRRQASQPHAPQQPHQSEYVARPTKPKHKLRGFVIKTVVGGTFLAVVSSGGLAALGAGPKISREMWGAIGVGSGANGAGSVPPDNRVVWGASPSPSATPTNSTSPEATALASPSPSARKHHKNASVPLPSRSPSPSESPLPSASPSSASPTAPSPSPHSTASLPPRSSGPQPVDRSKLPPSVCLLQSNETFRVGQRLAIGLYTSQLAEAAPIIDKYNIGTIVIMDAASRKKLSAFKARQRVPVSVATDGEGGPYADRYMKKVGEIPSEQDMASHYSLSEAEQKVEEHAARMHHIGINWNLSPVLDVNNNGTNVLGDRTFSGSISVNQKYGAAYARANQLGGLIATGKHWPLGVKEHNTDVEKSVVDFNKYKGEMAVYKALPKGTVIMFSNTVVQPLTKGMPASLSPEAVQLFRQTEGQQTTSITDSLNAYAVTHATPQGLTQAEAAAKAALAGVDIEMVMTDPSQPFEAQVAAPFNAIKAEVDDGSISQDQMLQSDQRVLETRQVNPCLVPDLPQDDKLATH